VTTAVVARRSIVDGTLIAQAQRMNRDKELDDLAKVDRQIADAERHLRDLESTMREAPPNWHDATKAQDLLAVMRLTLVKHKARRAAILQFIQDTESGRL
jgi:hypothetical protein